MITITVKIEKFGEGVQLAVSSEAQDAGDAEKAMAHIINTGLIQATTYISERCKESFILGGKNIPPEVLNTASDKETKHQLN